MHPLNGFSEDHGMFHRFQRYFYPNHFSHFIRPSTTCIDHQRSLDSLPTSRLYCLNPTRVEASQCLVVFHLNATHLNPKHESPTLQPLTSESDFLTISCLSIFKIEVASSSKIPTFILLVNFCFTSKSQTHSHKLLHHIFLLPWHRHYKCWLDLWCRHQANKHLHRCHPLEEVGALSSLPRATEHDFPQTKEAKKVPTWLPRSNQTRKIWSFGL